MTVLRIKFAKNDGSEFTSMDLKGQRYVYHCHLLEHEDNEMMKYFCLKWIWKEKEMKNLIKIIYSNLFLIFFLSKLR